MTDKSDLLKKSLLALDTAKAKIKQIEQSSYEPIAIIGLSCRFPAGADSAEQFWQLLDSGNNGVSDTLSARWQPDENFEYHSAGLLSQVTEFDADYFKISEQEAKYMDPQQRVLLETTCHAIADSGYEIAEFNQVPVGVFVGLMNHDYANLTDEISAYTGSGTASSIASGRLSYFFGLTGPSVTIDTACSSSLVAVHYACQSLRQRECDRAIAAGVNLILSPQRMLTMAKANMLSKTGRCHAFSAAADGYVRSEGCGVLVLKRLSDALASQDRILGIIRGSAVNQDGRSQGLTAPNGPAQQTVIRRALAQAKLSANDVSYVEAHGTGTPLGDPVEINALQSVYGVNRSAEHPLWVGAVKTNIGHAESAAGMAGLIKVLLALQHQKIPANLNFHSPNPHIDWEQLSIKIVEQSIAWPMQALPRIAGISSFGFSGTNAHILIAEPPVLEGGIREKLPEHPFQRAHYWLSLPVDKKTEFCKILLPNDEILFQAEWHKKTFPYLADHLVLDSQVVPASAYIDWLMQIIPEVIPHQTYLLDDCKILAPLVLTEAVQVIQILFTRLSDSHYEIEIYSNRHHRHFSAKLNPQLGVIDSPPIESTPMSDGKDILPEVLYHVAHNAGVYYGASFKLISRLRQDSSFVHTEMVFASSITQILDVCLQSLTLILYGQDVSKKHDYCYLPVSAQRISLIQLPFQQKNLHVHAELVSHHPEYAEAHIMLFSSAGDLLVAMERVRFQNVSHSHLQQRLGVKNALEDALYQLTWEQQVCFSTVPASLHFKPIGTISSGDCNDLIDVFMPALEHIALQIIIQNLTQLGWDFSVETPVYLADFVSRAGIINLYLPLLERMIHLLEQQDYIKLTSNGWKASRHFKREEVATLAFDFQQEYSNGQAELALLMKTADTLHAVLRGGLDPLQLLFHEDVSGNAEHAYQHAMTMQRLHRQVKSALTQLISMLPSGQGLRVLEIGAGTGSTTAEILSTLNCDNIEYYFTDISQSFIQKAQVRFSSYPCMRYQRLDIEQEPVAQGFALHEFDVVIAANVLHATRSLNDTLIHIQQLLAPNAVLLLLEQTHDHAWLDLTFGLTEGWWRFTDKSLRPHHPLLSHHQWLDQLTDKGFKAVRVDSDYQTESVFIAQYQHPFIAPPHEQILLLANHSDFCQAFIECLQARGITPICIYPEDASIELFFKKHLDDKTIYSRIVSLWTDDNELSIHHGEPKEQQSIANVETSDFDRLCRSANDVLLIIQRLLAYNPKQLKLWLVTSGAQAAGDVSSTAGLFHAPIWGMVKSLAYEHPEFNVACVDVGGSDPRVLLAEIFAITSEDQIAYQNNKRWVARLSHYATQKSTTTSINVMPDATYLVAGGHSGIGLLTVEWMFANGARHFVVFGRQQPTAVNEAIISRLRADGAVIVVRQVDVCDYFHLHRLIDEIHESMPPLRGVVDAVGVLDDGILLHQNWQRYTQVLKPKVMGAWNLHCITQNTPLDFFVMYSSIASLIGSAGQSNHAAANAFLDQFCFYRRQQGLPATTINWGVWSEIGSAERRGIGARLQEQGSGIGSISPQEGHLFLNKIWSDNPTQIGILPMDWEAFAAAQPRIIAKPFFRHIFKPQQNQLPAAPVCTDNLLALLENIKNVKQQERLLLKHLQAKVALLLNIKQPQSIQAQHRLFDAGLDSLMAMELRDYLQRELQVTLPPTLLFDCPTLGQLIHFIMQMCFSPATEKDIMQLSDKEAEALLLRELSL